MKHLVMMILVTTVAHALPDGDDDEPMGLAIIAQAIKENHLLAQQRVAFFAQKLATCTDKEKLFYMRQLILAQKERKNNAQLLAKRQN